MKILILLLLLVGLKGYSQKKDTITDYGAYASEAKEKFQIVYCDYTKLYAIRFGSDTTKYLGWLYSTSGNTVYKGLTITKPFQYSTWNGVHEANFRITEQAQNLINILHKLGLQILLQDSINKVSHIYRLVN